MEIDDMCFGILPDDQTSWSDGLLGFEPVDENTLDAALV